MSQKSVTFEYDLDGDKVVITSTRASARVGVARYQMMMAGEARNETEEDEALKPLRLITYPDCASCSTVTKNGEPWKVDFDTFVEMPEDLVNLWLGQCHVVNPQWFSGPEVGTTEEKKANESKN
jgi:hypothetical protein